MIPQKPALIHELTSPLQRIMWLQNADDAVRRTFENNICAFHIGNGYFLTVAHNLRTQTGYLRSISEKIYQRDILPRLDAAQRQLFEQSYVSDYITGVRYLAGTEPARLQALAAMMRQIRHDMRWIALAAAGTHTPHLIMQFKNDLFYEDPALTAFIKSNMRLYDNDAQKYTYLLEVELVEAFYSADIALYKIKGMPPNVIGKIPAIRVNYDLLDESVKNFYCLQSSPNGPAGRLVNEAHIEGLIDHFGIFQDDVEGNYLFEGYRYLVKGYFRFGSSGAPYVYYDAGRGEFIANAVQSEASGIQLSIKNDRDGNFQYINAIASPLHIIKDALEKYINPNP